MTAALPRSPVVTACRRDPERWFDPRDRRHALEHCLACPRRRWCAQAALTVRPSFGMWAGIWINRDFPRAASYLRAIAHDLETESRLAPPEPPAALPEPVPLTTTLRGRGATRSICSPAALIAARASGHCEVMTAQCGLGYDAIVSRLTGPRARVSSPAEGFAACRHCARTLRDADQAFLVRCGYRCPPREANLVPFYWRQCRWVLLDGSGELAPAEVVA